MQYLSFVIILILALDCNASKRLTRPSHLANRPIVGGDDAQINHFPYQVSLGVLGEEENVLKTSHFCGGSIISVDWVLTAAHCVHGDSPEDLGVRVGTSVMNEGGFIHKVTDVIAHPDYDPETTDSDIALLKVEKPFEFGPHVKPIPLNKFPLRNGALATVSGWGAVSEGGDAAEMLQKVQVPIVPLWECKWLYGPEKISEFMFCAGRAGKDSCQGDSGGPIVANGYQIGVVSWGEGCARPGYPGIYTNVHKMRKWILQNSGV